MERSLCFLARLARHRLVNTDGRMSAGTVNALAEFFP
jgi:hypothetical protein